MNLNLNNKTYDFLNILVRYILPGLGTLYFTLSEIWGLPRAVEVMGTIVAVTTFLGLVIAFARRGWKEEADSLLIDKSDPDEIRFGFESGRHVEDLEPNQTIHLSVKDVSSDPRRAEF